VGKNKKYYTIVFLKTPHNISLLKEKTLRGEEE
jgi:hypothetical protein